MYIIYCEISQFCCCIAMRTTGMYDNGNKQVMFPSTQQIGFYPTVIIMDKVTSQLKLFIHFQWSKSAAMG